ncbi:MAG: HU family DNA-binding protein [Nitrospirae bacterium]|nr:HU family DNA-binding protein [Nitrospirota bacterium]
MLKSELAIKISSSANITISDAEKVIEAAINSIITTAKDGQKVMLIGFGSFFLSGRSETERRNPNSGEKVKILASKLPKFAAGKAFKDAVNETSTKINEKTNKFIN